MIGSNMNPVDRALAQWLEIRFGGYQVSGVPRLGTFGQVWVMEATGEQMFPRRVARKTINPRKLAGANADDLLPIFEREMHLWLHMPFHPNILPALCIDVAELPDLADWRPRRLPLVAMPYCERNLEDWIESPLVGTMDRLFALCQLANGLAWLYEHGIEGHGDLKPANVLISDLDSRFARPTELMALGRWLIRVADLGWANAWIDLGFSDRAWRPYLAPERFDNTFVPIASDVLAVGVIGAELVQGRHPAGDSAARIGNVVFHPKWHSRDDSN